MIDPRKTMDKWRCVVSESNGFCLLNLDTDTHSVSQEEWMTHHNCGFPDALGRTRPWIEEFQGYSRGIGFWK